MKRPLTALLLLVCATLLTACAAAKAQPAPASSVRAPAPPAQSPSGAARLRGDDPIPGAGIPVSYTPEQARRDGCVVMIYDDDTAGYEVYNIHALDRFIDSVAAGIPARVRVLHYARQKGKTWINKLNDESFDGTKLADTAYDPYTGGSGVTPYDRLTANGTSSPDARRYAMLMKGDPENMGGTLISFPLSAVKD